MQTNRVTGCVVWNNKYPRIYKNTTRLMLACGAEARADTGKTKRQVRVLEIGILRQTAEEAIRIIPREYKEMCGKNRYRMKEYRFGMNS